MIEFFGLRRAVVSYRFGPFYVKDSESLWINDTLIPLSPLQLRLLSYLCAHPQQVLDKQRIAENVWGRSDVSDVSLARAVHGLRQRLAVGTRASELIRNIYGRGYMLTQPVAVSGDKGPASLPVRNPEDIAAAEAPIASVRHPQAPPITAVATLERSKLRALR